MSGILLPKCCVSAPPQATCDAPPCVRVTGVLHYYYSDSQTYPIGGQWHTRPFVVDCNVFDATSPAVQGGDVNCPDHVAASVRCYGWYPDGLARWGVSVSACVAQTFPVYGYCQHSEESYCFASAGGLVVKPVSEGILGAYPDQAQQWSFSQNICYYQNGNLYCKYKLGYLTDVVLTPIPCSVCGYYDGTAPKAYVDVAVTGTTLVPCYNSPLHGLKSWKFYTSGDGGSERYNVDGVYADIPLTAYPASPSTGALRYRKYDQTTIMMGLISDRFTLANCAGGSVGSDSKQTTIELKCVTDSVGQKFFTIEASAQASESYVMPLIFRGTSAIPLQVAYGGGTVSIPLNAASSGSEPDFISYGGTATLYFHD